MDKRQFNLQIFQSSNLSWQEMYVQYFHGVCIRVFMSLNLLYVDDLHFLSCSKSTLHPVINCKPGPFIAPFEFNVVFVHSLLDLTFSKSWKVFLFTIPKTQNDFRFT